MVVLGLNHLGSIIPESLERRFGLGEFDPKAAALGKVQRLWE